MENTAATIPTLEKYLGIALHPCADWAEFHRAEARNICLTDQNGALLALDLLPSGTTILDLSAFALPDLCWLILSENEPLEQLLLPASLPALVHLDASRCALTELEIPADAFSRQFFGDPPRTVPALYLQKNKLHTLRFRGTCPGLELLDLSNNAFAAFRLPAGFERLTYLYLNDNPALAMLEFDAPLRELDTLHLRDCKLDQLPRLLLSCTDLKTLYLHGNPLGSLPTGVVSKGEHDNAWQSLRAYLQELGKKQVTNERVKIIIVGNGRVGKTSMLRRLRGEPFNPNEKYTHGIQLGRLGKEHLPGLDAPGLQAQVWDFGGQEIFYATHQFFLSEDALYILAWTAEDNVVPYRRRDTTLPGDTHFRKNEYWLENIRHRGGQECPILMVQTHYKQRRSPCNEDDLMKNYAALCFNFDAAEADYGLSDIKDAIAVKLSTEIPFFGRQMPDSYDRCIGAVEKLRGLQPRIPKTEFEAAVCRGSGVDPGNETEALRYLHNVGAVVWFSGVDALKDTVFTDPRWLTDRVYELINKELEKSNGRFDTAYLEKHLPAFSAAERVQFVELLKTFGLIFETKEGAYIAPNYLPETPSPEIQEVVDDYEKELAPAFRFAFPKFLPDNVMVNFLSRYGPYSKKLYWKNAICFTDQSGQDALVRLDGQTLGVCTKPDEAAYGLQAAICQAFVELSGNANAEISVEGRTVSWQALKNAAGHAAENTLIPDTRGEYVPLSLFGRFLGREGLPPGRTQTPAKPLLYFSYSWDDAGQPAGESREQIVRDLIAELEREGRFELKYDKKDATYRTSIRAFEQEIGRARRIVVVVSDKYLRSPHCMYELLQIFRKSGSEAVTFREKIFPIVLDGANIHNSKSIIAYIKHWKEDVEDLKKAIDDVGWDLAVSAIPDFVERKEIMQNIGELAKIIGDLNTLTPQHLSADNFDHIKKALSDDLSEQPDQP